MKLCTPLKQVEDPFNEAEHPNFETYRPKWRSPFLGSGDWRIGQRLGCQNLMPGKDGPNVPELTLHKSICSTDVSEHLKD